MLVVLISAVGLGTHLRSENVDREVLENNQYTMENMTIILTEHKYFNQSIEMTSRERSQRMSEKMRSETRQIMNLPTVRAEVYMLGSVYYSNLFPLLPSYLPGEKSKSIIFSKDNGYFLTDAYPEMLAEIEYFQHRIENLNRKVNSSRGNWTLKKYRNRVENIKSVKYPDEKIITYLENKSETRDPRKFGGLVRTDELSNYATQNKIKEVRFYHFIPSAIATFLIYYILSGLIIEIFRLLRSEI
jgi:hypothetical protein